MVLICEVPRWQVGLSGVRVHGAPGDLFVARSAAESAGLGASAAASPDATGALGAVSLRARSQPQQAGQSSEGGPRGHCFLGSDFFSFGFLGLYLFQTCRSASPIPPVATEEVPQTQAFSEVPDFQSAWNPGGGAPDGAFPSDFPQDFGDFGTQNFGDFQDGQDGQDLGQGFGGDWPDSGEGEREKSKEDKKEKKKKDRMTCCWGWVQLVLNEWAVQLSH